MIRINLLPVKAAKKRATGQRQVILMAALVAVAGLAVTGFHMAEASDLGRMQQENKDLKEAIAKLKAQTIDYDQVRAQREKLIRQRETIKKLQDGRGGPVWAMKELSDILTKDRGPTFDKEHYEDMLRKDPNAGYNPSWDPKRVWVASVSFHGGGVHIAAGAKANDDVAEYMKRLELSIFFDNVRLSGTQAQGGGSGKWYSFSISAGVNY